MEGLKQALELIQSTATRAQTAVLHDLLDPRKIHVQQGNTLQAFDVPPPLRDHHVHTLADLIAYLGKHEAAVVWHGHAGVIAVLDDADRRDRVTFALTLSQRFARLEELAAGRPTFDQSKFVRLLRIELGLDNVAIVARFRKLNWENGDRARGEAGHGDTRLSREVVAKVEGLDQLPEELSVPVPVYQQAGERQEYIVKCAVEIDAVNRCFQLLPLPDELERVIDCAQADIRSRLADEVTVPIYFGCP